LIDFVVVAGHRRHETDHVEAAVAPTRLHDQACVLTLLNDGAREFVRRRLGLTVFNQFDANAARRARG
jgi:hypothetical protein